MSRVRFRAGRLGYARPVPARRAVGGVVRLVVVSDVRERAAMVAASIAGAVALVGLLVGIVVTL